MSADDEAVQRLIDSARAQDDAVEWAASLLVAVKRSAEDLQFFVETFNAGAAAWGRHVVGQSEIPRCSFCLKTSRDVERMVSSPNANICNECVAIAAETLAQHVN